MPDVQIIKASALSADQIRQWQSFRDSLPIYAVPFFDPEFFQIVAQYRPELLIAVLRVGPEVVGFFPFERGRLGIGRPGASVFSDYHAPILAAGTRWVPIDLVRQCGLGTWDYWAVPVDFEPMLGHHTCTERALAIDPRQPVRWQQSLTRKGRKLAREIGELRFVPHVETEAMLATLVRWKSSHYERTGAVNLLHLPGVQDILRHLMRHATPDFGGMFSVLYAGERPVACNFGMRSGRWMHWWFPSYDTDLAGYSPGMLLIREMVTHALEAGFERIDFGPGDEPFKLELGNTSTEIGRGSVEAPSLIRAGRLLRRRADGWIAGTPLRGPVRRTINAVRRVLHRAG